MVTGQRDQAHTTDTMTSDKLSYAQRHILVYTIDKNIFSTCNLQSTQNRNSYTHKCFQHTIRTGNRNACFRKKSNKLDKLSDYHTS